MMRILSSVNSCLRFAPLGLASLFLVIVPQLALADVIALHSGERVEGMVSNREQIATSPQLFRAVAILPDGETELRRFDIADIEYVLLIDGDEQRLIDFGKPPPVPTDTAGVETPVTSSYPSKTIQPPMKEAAKRRKRGIGLMAVGATAILVGSLVKFGGSETTVTSDGLEYSEKTYNAGNWALIIGGTAFASAGLVLYYTARSNPSIYGYAPSEFGVGWVIAEF